MAPSGPLEGPTRYRALVTYAESTVTQDLPPRTLTRDRLLVTLGAVLCVVGTILGTGVAGSSVETQGEGLFSDQATLIAPDGPAFAIWSVIYAGLAGYVVWQWLPVSAASAWAAFTRVPAAASLALNGLWLIVVQQGWVWGSVVVIVLLLASLIAVYRGLRETGQRSTPASTVLVEATFGLYLGWVCVAICANIALALVGSGAPATGTVAAVSTVLVLSVVVAIAALLFTVPAPAVARAAAAAAIVWGLSWIAVGRLTDEPRSALVGWWAAAAAILVVVALLVLRRRPSAGPGQPRPAQPA